MPDSQLTNAQLAASINDLINLWRTRELQMVAWISGPAGGGDLSNGTYPLSDYLGNVTYQPSPAQLSSEVVGPVADATTRANAAAASATTASGAQTAAQTARDLALSYQTGAQAARDLAKTYANNSASSAAAALFSQNAAATSQSSAATSETNAAASAAAAAASVISAGTEVTAASSSASAAANAAAAAAASAVAAATFNPTLYRLKSVAIADADISGLAWSKLTGSPADIRSVGQIRATGWFNTPSTDPNALGIEIGESGGQAYMLAYDRTSSSYGAMNLRGSLINLLSQTTINTGTVQPLELITSSSDPWALSLTRSDLGNSVKVYNTGGAWAFGNQVIAPLFNSSGDMYTAGGYRWANDTTFYIYNTVGYNYGSWRIGGTRNTYVGLVLDDSGGRHPTFMASSSTVGVYNQGISRWSWYEDYPTGLFHTTGGIFVDSYNGCALVWGNGQTSGRCIVQSGGSPSGGSPGDVYFIY